MKKNEEHELDLQVEWLSIEELYSANFTFIYLSIGSLSAKDSTVTTTGGGGG